jgi:hypothetical protein
MTLTQTPDLKTFYKEADYSSARLPRLEPAQFTDPNKGLWEFWGLDANDLTEHRIRARNPADDVKDWNVAIDFGTSSTVIAYDDNGPSKLLRIGMKDFWEKEQPAHYENPTLLEFIDFIGLLNAWQKEAYRPCVEWDQVHCSHEALTRLRDNVTIPEIISSILTKLKQWALREGNNHRVRLTDQRNKFEHQLAALTQRLPVRGQPLTVSPADPFDPIELYAWFLGLTINWRGRGIFLRYYMTFPVAYPKQVKENILASFQRGLQRSLPETLIKQPIFNNFTVEERASEPAAYAAIALRQLGIAPTVEGIAYAVFDFGGGTADFDCGYYRLPSAEEDDDGWEQVFEHVGAAGDRFLGGENLLENMAYLVFRHNLEICRAKHTAFTRPLDADDFPGSELFIDQTQAAATNTVILMSKLRPLWEGGGLNNSSGIEKIQFFNRESSRELCEFAIPEATLKTYLEERITAGVKNFLLVLKKSFEPSPPVQIHVLLAGNASRSCWVKKIFEPMTDDQTLSDQTFKPESSGWIAKLFKDKPPTPVKISSAQSYLANLFNGKAPELIVHLPVPISKEHPYQPTAKTGVALGLLNLCPGGVIKVINRPAAEAEGEAPFAHYIGRERAGSFQVGINQGAVYGEWRELGAPRERVFNLYHTQSPRAHTGELRIGEAGLYKLRLDFAGNTSGKRVFGRAIAPNEIEICTAAAREMITDDCDNQQRIKLD